VIFGVGVDGAIRERTQWRDLLLAQAAPLMQWVERQFRGGRLFYWRTNPALSMRLKRPSTPADINGEKTCARVRLASLCARRCTGGSRSYDARARAALQPPDTRRRTEHARAGC
jgi:hypothetical protein